MKFESDAYYEPMSDEQLAAALDMDNMEFAETFGYDENTVLDTFEDEDYAVDLNAILDTFKDEKYAVDFDGLELMEEEELAMVVNDNEGATSTENESLLIIKLLLNLFTMLDLNLSLMMKFDLLMQKPSHQILVMTTIQHLQISNNDNLAAELGYCTSSESSQMGHSEEETSQDYSDSGGYDTDDDSEAGSSSTEQNSSESEQDELEMQSEQDESEQDESESQSEEDDSFSSS